MVKPQVDPESGDKLPDFGVYGSTVESIEEQYKKFRTNETEEDAMFLMKAGAAVNTTCFSELQSVLSTGRLRLLVDETVAREKLLGTSRGKKMTPEERDDYLRPFVLTSRLKDEMLNLRQDNEGINIILKQANKSIQKDKFSSLVYGLYCVKEEEENRKRRRRKKFKVSDMMFRN